MNTGRKILLNTSFDGGLVQVRPAGQDTAYVRVYSQDGKVHEGTTQLSADARRGDAFHLRDVIAVKKAAMQAADRELNGAVFGKERK